MWKGTINIHALSTPRPRLVLRNGKTVQMNDPEYTDFLITIADWANQHVDDPNFSELFDKNNMKDPNFALGLEATYYIKSRQNTPYLRKAPDIDNLAKAIQDGIFYNDLNVDEKVPRHRWQSKDGTEHVEFEYTPRKFHVADSAVVYIKHVKLAVKTTAEEHIDVALINLRKDEV